MSGFPITIAGHTFHNHAELVAGMRIRGEKRQVRHRGDIHPAEAFNEFINSDFEPMIAAAAAELLRQSNHPGVLELVAHLQFGRSYPDLFEALLERFEKKDLPKGQGMRHGELRADLTELLHRWLPHNDFKALKRAEVLLEGAEDPSHFLHFLADSNEKPEKILEVLAKLAATKDFDPYLAIYAGQRLAQAHPVSLSKLSHALRDAEQASRDLVFAELKRLKVL